MDLAQGDHWPCDRSRLRSTHRSPYPSPHRSGPLHVLAQAPPVAAAAVLYPLLLRLLRHRPHRHRSHRLPCALRFRDDHRPRGSPDVLRVLLALLPRRPISASWRAPGSIHAPSTASPATAALESRLLPPPTGLAL